MATNWKNTLWDIILTILTLGISHIQLGMEDSTYRTLFQEVIKLAFANSTDSVADHFQHFAAVYELFVQR